MTDPAPTRPTAADLVKAIEHLSDDAIELVHRIVTSLLRKYDRIAFDSKSPLMSSRVVSYLGNVLRIHHALSSDPFSKDKFEHAIVAAWNFDGRKAGLARRGNPGHDATVDGVRISLKTQADSAIKDHEIHISKFMELGKGEWKEKVEHLERLRQSFFNHMAGYDRVLILRCLPEGDKRMRYELVEIPMSLLNLAKSGTLRIVTTSMQDPKPGYCEVYRKDTLLFRLYFDGGTERKLQVQKVLKTECHVIAEWAFQI